MASLPNFNALLMEGFNTGREMRRQEGAGNALAGLVNGDPNAVGELARYDPQAAYQVKQQQDQQAAKAQERQQKMLAEGKKVVGQAALQIAQLPEAQRPQAWDQAIDYLAAQGWDGLLQYKGKYNPQNLMGVISEAGLANELRTATQPSYQVIPEGGTLVDTRNPAALSQFGQPQAAPAPAPQVPQGSPLQGAPNSKVIGNKQYWLINGEWYDNPEGR